jgi:hypothetical protein
MKKLAMILGVVLAASGAQCADKAIAAALAKSGAALAEKGKPDAAKEMLFKALANDSDCPEALYEIGKIFEKEGNNTTAGDFLLRAAQQLGAEEAANPDFAKKRKDAEARAQRLNPYSAQLTAAFSDYTTELNAIVKRVPDTLTLEEACDRVDQLRLKTMVPPDKAPKFERPAPKQPERTLTPRERMIEEMNGRSTTAKAPTVVPPDIERALKDPAKGGWDTITGTWKKKAEGVYEVTDGKLETKKTDGAVMCVVHPASITGKVKIMVRNNDKDDEGYFYSDASGFGVSVNNDGTKFYTPASFFSSGTTYRPYLERTDPVPAGPKVQYMVMVEGQKLEYHVNNAPKKKTGTTNITKNGTMVIQIDGTAIIEMPRAAGR